MRIEIARNDPEDYSSEQSEEPRHEQHGKARNATDSELDEAADFLNPITPSASRLNNLNKWLKPAAALERDGHSCTVPECRAEARHVGIVVSRRGDGADTLANLRCLCDHSQIKETSSGKRQSGGNPYLRGTGNPLDPAHCGTRWRTKTKAMQKSYL